MARRAAPGGKVTIPGRVLRELTGRSDVVLDELTVEPIGLTNGAATSGIWRVHGVARAGGDMMPVRVVVKALTADGGAPDPTHWAYWRREALAYTSDLLPTGGLAAPRCWGVEETPTGARLYLAEVPDGPPDLPRAARLLGEWQGRYLVEGVPTAPWLAGHQLAQRITRTDATGGLDFAALPLDPGLRRRLADAWAVRARLLAALAAVPATLCHGDFHAWNIFAGTGGQVIVIDWGGFGVGPIGGDLGYLVLSDPGPATDRLRQPYLDGLAAAGWRDDPRAAQLGYCATAGLTGVSRTHWTLSRDPAAPMTGYAEWSADRVAEALALAG
jgi:hypothetical protein